jgi:hypothetical protein
MTSSNLPLILLLSRRRKRPSTASRIGNLLLISFVSGMGQGVGDRLAGELYDTGKERLTSGESEGEGSSVSTSQPPGRARARRRADAGAGDAGNTE